MERFLRRHEGRIIGVLSGFDRMVFRGILPSIIHTQGMAMYLSSQHVLYKDFRLFAERISNQIKEHARTKAKRFARPFHYLPSSSPSKEEIARAIAKKDNIKQGLVCVLPCVEPCKSYTICRNPETKMLDLRKLERKCLHLYFYYLGREFGLMHLRLQTWFPFSPAMLSRRLTVQKCYGSWVGARTYFSVERRKVSGPNAQKVSVSNTGSKRIQSRCTTNKEAH